ncbi:MAG: NADH dehydrogenase [Candidatus Alkanophagales archaeon MCA70_species_1]|nr:NADH dehydrogenase [Candidatus Alkanophaga volatiphilum]
MKSILILGSGAAGTAIANKLARELRREIANEEVEITVLDKSDLYQNQGVFTFIPFDLYTKEDAVRQRKKLLSPRVKYFFGEDGEVSKIDLGNREVTVKSGKKYAYDYLVVATGCRHDLGVVPGLSDDYNTFYTLEGALELREKLKTLRGGRIVVAVPRMPISCPGAPGKFTVMLDDYLRYVRRIRENFTISLLWPMESIGPPPYNANISRVFEEKGIEVSRNFKFASLDAERKEVISADGERIKYDLLVVAPPHRAAEALEASEMIDENGWIPVNKRTLQYQNGTKTYDEVYVAGDTGPADILKTGIGTHYQAMVVAQNLINDVTGVGVRATYNGEVGCPFVGEIYSDATKGAAYIPSWTYNKPPEPFKPSKLGWIFYRSYYYLYWEMNAKALM